LKPVLNSASLDTHEAHIMRKNILTLIWCMTKQVMTPAIEVDWPNTLFCCHFPHFYKGYNRSLLAFCYKFKKEKNRPTLVYTRWWITTQQDQTCRDFAVCYFWLITSSLANNLYGKGALYCVLNTWFLVKSIICNILNYNLHLKLSRDFLRNGIHGNLIRKAVFPN
jgi:hypothetical protein